jgi:hypothetical protein
LPQCDTHSLLLPPPHLPEIPSHSLRLLSPSQPSPAQGTRTLWLSPTLPLQQLLLLL